MPVLLPNEESLLPARSGYQQDLLTSPVSFFFTSYLSYRVSIAIFGCAPNKSKRADVGGSCREAYPGSNDHYAGRLGCHPGSREHALIFNA